MPLSISSWSTTRHETPTTGKFDLQTTRSLALLKTVFVTFDAAAVADRPGAHDAEKYAHTNATLLFNPQNGKDTNIAEDTLSWQLDIGARTWPVFPVRGTSETYYHLRQAIDQNRYGFLNITKEDYLTKDFIIGCDTEKASGQIDGANFTGMACRSGEPITVRIRDLDAAHKAKTAYIHLCHDVVIQISAGAVDVLE